MSTAATPPSWRDRLVREASQSASRLAPVPVGIPGDVLGDRAALGIARGKEADIFLGQLAHQRVRDRAAAGADDSAVARTAIGRHPDRDADGSPIHAAGEDETAILAIRDLGDLLGGRESARASSARAVTRSASACPGAGGPRARA